MTGNLLHGVACLAAVLMLGVGSGAQEPAAAGKRFAIALHGGAGHAPERMTAAQKAEVETGLRRALDVGVSVLREGGTSLEAVEKVIRVLEDDPLFNAGRGAVFNAAGQHELDASIMDGKSLACGGVAAVRTAKNPISLARLVMEKTRHVLLTSDGAEKFADEMGVERVDNSWFSTEKRRQELERAQRGQDSGDKRQGAGNKGPAAGKMAQWSVEDSPPANLQHVAPGNPRLDPHSPSDILPYGTVGCVALDSHGNLAAGTSTGGRTNKKYGRVGDSPIVGAGTYANNATCAVSGTGLGEQFIRHAVAYDISARVAYLKQPLKEAVHDVLFKTLNREDGGVIALGPDGTIVMDFSTGGMARAAADWRGRREVKIGR